MDYSQIEAGVEADALVAERLNIERVVVGLDHLTDREIYSFEPSTDPTSCHAALEKMREMGWEIVWTANALGSSGQAQVHHCTLINIHTRNVIRADAATFALAATRAMLMATESNKHANEIIENAQALLDSTPEPVTETKNGVLYPEREDVMLTVDQVYAIVDQYHDECAKANRHAYDNIRQIAKENQRINRIDAGGEDGE